MAENKPNEIKQTNKAAAMAPDTPTQQKRPEENQAQKRVEKKDVGTSSSQTQTHPDAKPSNNEARRSIVSFLIIESLLI